MKTSLASTVAALSVLALLGALVLLGGDPGPTSDRRSAAPPAAEELVFHRPAGGGSSVPCAAPLGWRIARVDSAFGLTPDEARRVMAEAASLWEDATGRVLFPHRPEDGFPVRFVDDGRLARSRARADLGAAWWEGERTLAERREGLAERQRALERSRDSLGAAFDDFRRRLEAHNEETRRANEAGGAGPARAAELDRRGDALERERATLRARQDTVEALGDALREAADDYNRDVTAHRERAEALERDFPATAVESALYREGVRSEGGRVVAVGREMRVHRFDDLQELRRILAHELGHALGLRHLDGPGGLMSASYRGSDLAGGVGVTPADLALLGERCPDLR